MAILTTIGGVPLFTTLQEALAWARSRGLNGYHIHNWQGQRGYMGGFTHSGSTGSNQNNNNISPPSASPMSGGGGGSY